LIATFFLCLLSVSIVLIFLQIRIRRQMTPSSRA
jgi:hypothetical protein